MKYFINSLSLGVRVIYEQKLDPKDCDLAILGTRIEDLESLARVLESYSSNYWQEAPAEMRKIAFQLWTNSRIIQPRLDGMDWYCIQSPGPKGGHVFQHIEDMAFHVPKNKEVMDFYHLL